MADTFVEERRAALEHYMAALVAHPAIARSEVGKGLSNAAAARIWVGRLWRGHRWVVSLSLPCSPQELLLFLQADGELADNLPPLACLPPSPQELLLFLQADGELADNLPPLACLPPSPQELLLFLQADGELADNPAWRSLVPLQVGEGRGRGV